MLQSLFAPPALYGVIALVAVVLVVALLSRKRLAKELRRWKLKEIAAGPATFERDPRQTAPSPGNTLEIGPEVKMEGATIRKLRVGDNIQGPAGSAGPSGDAHVTIGKNSTLKNTTLEDIHVGDSITSTPPPGKHAPPRSTPFPSRSTEQTDGKEG